MIENAIQEFANRMEMPEFALNEHGMACLELEQALFHFEQTQNELLLYLSFPLESYDDTASLRLLELSHYKHNYPFNLFTGMFSNTGIMLTRMQLNEVTSASIENNFHFLLTLLPKALGR